MIVALIVIAALLVLSAAVMLWARGYIRRTKSDITLSRFLWDYMISEPIMTVVRGMPGGWGMALRYILYNELLSAYGKGSTVSRGVIINFPKKVKLGDYTSLNDECFLDGRGGIDIGSWVRTGARTMFLTSSHRFSGKDALIKHQGLEVDGIKVCDDVFIGAGSIILPGVKVGKGSVIGAGSVVTGDVAPYTVVCGNPAKPIKKRK